MAFYTFTKLDLFTPSLNEVAAVLQKGLKENFSEAVCEVVECPNLSDKPWSLAAEGIGVSPVIGEIGGVKYLSPLPRLEKVYDFKKLAEAVNLPNGFFIGAGAGPHEYAGTNCEMIPNIRVGDAYKNESVVSKTSPSGCVVEKLPSQESRFSILLNFFACEGTRGPVIRVRVKNRTGTDDLVGCMRKALEREYESKPVGVGGTFMMEKGTAKIHVMPDFSKTPLISDDDVNQWLKFINMKGPMRFMSVFVSRDPGFDFRLEHSHGCNDVEGGHYHYDVTPDEVEYVGYFNVANEIYRVDQPQ